ncbi:MAG: NADH-quinone oxidoreductase subunit A [Akkermansiaceae bacterium]|jgi:NADH-quinone oxidoreductase subunit A|tara:strand:+ start:14734 stop:15105 length:372 start_codon:yes stop_codon:yes gene_type:complete
MLSDYLPVIFQAFVAIGFAVIALGLSVLLGKKGRDSKIKNTPYECGMLPIGDGAPRFSVKFYVIAMLFVIFDIEVVFSYPWALAFRDSIQESTMILWSFASFAGILAVAYVYALKKGAFDWKS